MDHSEASKNEETEVSNSISRHGGKSTESFTYHCLNRIKSPIDLTENNLPGNPKTSKTTWNGRLKNLVKSEIITNTRKVRRVEKEFKELRYFVKWAGCSEDANTWEPPEGLVNAREMVDKFQG